MCVCVVVPMHACVCAYIYYVYVYGIYVHDIVMGALLLKSPRLCTCHLYTLKYYTDFVLNCLYCAIFMLCTGEIKLSNLMYNIVV